MPSKNTDTKPILCEHLDKLPQCEYGVLLCNGPSLSSEATRNILEELRNERLTKQTTHVMALNFKAEMLGLPYTLQFSADACTSLRNASTGGAAKIRSWPQQVSVMQNAALPKFRRSITQWMPAWVNATRRTGTFQNLHFWRGLTCQNFPENFFTNEDGIWWGQPAPARFLYGDYPPASGGVFDGTIRGSVFPAIRILYELGCRELYLLGADYEPADRKNGHWDLEHEFMRQLAAQAKDVHLEIFSGTNDLSPLPFKKPRTYLFETP